MVNVVALPWCSHSRTLPLLRKGCRLALLCVRSSDGCPCRFWNPRSERNHNRKGLQNHCTTTCSIAKDPPTLLQGTKRQDGCRCPDGCRCRFWNPLSERNRSQRGTTTAKNGTPLPWLLPFPNVVTVAKAVAPVSSGTLKGNPNR